MNRRIFITLVIGLLAQIGLSQNLDKAKLDRYFEVLEKNNAFMGSVAISQNGKIIYTHTIGFADVKNNIKPNRETKYRIGSISKTFTAVLVLKAIEEKKLQLNQTIEQFFPTIENASEITIKQLLSHRSGIHNFTSNSQYLSWCKQPKTETEMIEIISSGGSDFKPGKKARYSNSNFVLLTYILEKTFKKSYASLLTEYITKPLDLKNTYLGSSINIAGNECYSYNYDSIWKIEPETDISIPLGAGGIVSTPSDLVMFSNLLFEGELLKEESLEQMQTIKNRYGMGLFHIPFGKLKGYGHTGAIDGFVSAFGYFEEGNISYAITSNGGSYNINKIAVTLLKVAYNKPYDIPEFTSSASNSGN